MKLKMKPFVKWAGGKTQLLTTLNEIQPTEFNTYIEPFVGGGAVLFDLQPKNAIINDLNSELITTYKVIRDDVEGLMKELDKMIIEYNKSPKNYYYWLRKQKPTEDLKIAARLIMLNKTCFNGLYRINSEGQFNVPWSKIEKINQSTVYGEFNLRSISYYLNNNNVTIMNGDYKECIKLVKDGDYLFVDPPYDETFTNYQKEGFNRDDQIELRDILVELKNVKIITTNNSTEFILDLYKDFNQHIIKVNRNINPYAETTKNAGEEIILYNYDKNLVSLKGLWEK